MQSFPPSSLHFSLHLFFFLSFFLFSIFAVSSHYYLSAAATAAAAERRSASSGACITQRPYEPSARAGVPGNGMPIRERMPARLRKAWPRRWPGHDLSRVRSRKRFSTISYRIVVPSTSPSRPRRCSRMLGRRFVLRCSAVRDSGARKDVARARSGVKRTVAER